LEHAGDRKVLGKYDKTTGETTLYIGKKQSSLIDKLTGAATRRKEDAKNAFDHLVKSSFEKTKSSRVLTEADLKKVDDLADNVSKRTGRLGSHAVRADQMRWLALAVAGAGSYGEAKAKGPDGGPTLAMLGKFDQTVADTGIILQQRINSDASWQKDAEKFGDAI